MSESKSFIEVQFPVSKVSKESFKERKANYGQTLTGLGKWWGRKPLILVRAAIIGGLMPASDNPQKDTDIFLKILSMDERGLNKRRIKSIGNKDLYNLVAKSSKLSNYLDDWFEVDGNRVKIRDGVRKSDVEESVLKTFSYDEKLVYCCRPEELDNLDQATWEEINEHLGTTATNIGELVQQLSLKKYGHVLRVGDCFAGGGSIPFEAARVGCDSLASDLNPIAGILTWADFNICGATDSEKAEINAFMQTVYNDVSNQVEKLGIEKNEQGDRAVS